MKTETQSQFEARQAAERRRYDLEGAAERQFTMSGMAMALVALLLVFLGLIWVMHPKKQNDAPVKAAVEEKVSMTEAAFAPALPDTAIVLDFNPQASVKN